MFDSQKRFVMEDYQNKPTFSSFLPGIAGPMGVPVWCYYNNRGQAVCSFGAQDKDHAIMEFSSAHSAYQTVSHTGFRTFVKVNGTYDELFTDRCDMHIGMSEVEITCCQSGLQASAVYFGVPEERTAALARMLTVTNVSEQPIDLELLDGMSALVPYGLNQDFLKNMSNLAKAWMQAENMEVGQTYFRVRASLEDGAIVREVKGGNFCLGWDDAGTLLKPIVQPQLVFGQAKADILAEYPHAADLLSRDFTPGAVAMAAEDWGMSQEEALLFTARVVCAADSEPNANFGEGYWCDHWTYNLDLIESYLSVYPERREALLFDDARYRWYETKVFVNPRIKRYCMTENGLRQYHALDETAKTTNRKWMQTADGLDARSTLMEKLILLCAIKTATLDAAGMGVEMEGGRPGWYDALNGMPGLLGSSMAESCELARLLAFTADALEQRGGSIGLYEEIAQLAGSVSGLLAAEDDPFLRWHQVNQVKEAYRDATKYGYSGLRHQISCSELANSLREMELIVLSGIEKAEAENGGLIPTYFTFDAEDVTVTPEGPMPTVLVPKALPLFLEGPVRQFKLELSHEKKTALAERVRSSGLYDRKLKMYKVNESLAEVSYEAGRAKAFTPGWLENESVWLHMEYKYLLELLKNGLYAQFAEAFRDAAVPFLDPEMYGRSPLENSSFIASSANPDPSVHGRGFVARLSGSTAEFIHMWQILFFGTNPFYLEDGQLRLVFAPFLPEYLMPENGIVEAIFLGKIPVVYRAEGYATLIPGKTSVLSYRLTMADGTENMVCAPALDAQDALAVRNGSVIKIEVTME